MQDKKQYLQYTSILLDMISNSSTARISGCGAFKKISCKNFLNFFKNK